MTANGESTTAHNTLQYTAASLASASVANAVQNAGASTTMTFTFRLTNPIPQGGILKIVWPSEVSFLQTTGGSFATVTIYGTVQSGFTTEVTTGDRKILLKGLFPSSGLAVEAQDIVIVINPIYNPQSSTTSSSFTLATMDSSQNEIDKKSLGLTVTAGSPGTISVQSITPTSKTVDAQVTVQIYETTDLSPTSADLKVYWPGEISYVSSATMTCTKTFGFNNPTSACTIDTTNKYMLLNYYR